MRSVSSWRLGGSVILLGVTSVGLTGRLSGQQLRSASADQGTNSEEKIVMPAIDLAAEKAASPAAPAVPISPKTDPSPVEKPSASETFQPVVEADPSTPAVPAPSSDAVPSAPSAAPKTEPPPAEKPSAPENLKPVAEADPSSPAPLEVVSFKGVTPGASTIEEVEKSWGAPKEISKQDQTITQLYAIEPFDRVEVNYLDNKVTSIVVRFNQLLPAEKVAQQLGLNVVRPVLVSNALGEILGQAYPERGVLVAFEPGENKTKPSMKVSHIVLEPLNAEPFVLRAETELNDRNEACWKDLQVALKLDPKNARANWLAARMLTALEQLPKAEKAAAEAVRLEPDNPRHHATYGQILGQVGRLVEAKAEVQKAIDGGRDYPHLHARALCLLGDLTATGPKPDYSKALSYHTQALQTADRAADDPHPAIRIAAKEVLVDAHLGAAQDIAWGEWKEKQKAITRWVERAARFAQDLVEHEGGSADQLFRVYARGLAASVGLREGEVPQLWIDEVLRTGRQRIDDVPETARKAQCQWDLGLALFDAMQIYQLHGDHENAMKYGKSASEYLEKGLEQKKTPDASYLLGRLYYRLGAISAQHDRDHAAAVVWYDKAGPLLTSALQQDSVADVGRHGQLLVSMGASYWEIGQQKRATQLTQRGITLMEQAVDQEMLAPSAMAVPYNNLSVMHRRQGADDAAEKFQALAAKAKGTQVK